MSGDCGRCLKALRNVKSKVECNDCKQAFHCKCVNMSAEDVQALLDLDQFWRCESCSVNRRRSMALETISNITYDDIYKMFQELKADVCGIEKGLGNSLEGCHEQLREANDKLKNQSDEIAALRASLEKIMAENNDLRNTVKQLQVRVEDLEQYSRKNTFEIHGVPFHQNENVLAIVKNVGDAIGVPIEDSMVDACHRLKAKQGSGQAPGIIVKMVRRLDMENVMQKKRQKKDLSTRHLGLASDTPVYVNESLSPERRRLWGAARQVRKTKGYKYVWLRGGRIFARKDDGLKVMPINSMDDLEKM